MTYKKLGLKCGIELHQQLEGKKLFCNCPTTLRDDQPHFTVKRELKEETGLSGQINTLLGVYSNPSAQYHTVLMIGFLVKSYTGNLVAGDDAEDAASFYYDELPEIAFESHAKFIRKYYAAFSS